MLDAKNHCRGRGGSGNGAIAIAAAALTTTAWCFAGLAGALVVVAIGIAIVCVCLPNIVHGSQQPRALWGSTRISNDSSNSEELLRSGGRDDNFAAAALESQDQYEIEITPKASYRAPPLANDEDGGQLPTATNTATAMTTTNDDDGAGGATKSKRPSS